MRALARSFFVTAVISSVLVAAGSSASANVPFTAIASAGPLSQVTLGNDLSCQVAHTGDASLEFFPPSSSPADCGTFVAVGGKLYAPRFSAHDGTATSALGAYKPFTSVSQSGVTGSGTDADPYRVVTVASAGTTGLEITQTDSYVVGSESYQTDVAITNGSATSLTPIVYRAGDCYLAGSDQGRGIFDAGTGAIGCLQSGSGRIEEWVPITPGSNHYESAYSAVWTAIGSHAQFPDTCDCTITQDNGSGLSWSQPIPAGETVTLSHLTTFSPTGRQALVTTKTADASSVSAGGQDGYTITVSNPNATPVTLSSISDDLPAGFSYRAGSTSGVTTADPSVSGQSLTWSGSFSVPAQGSVSLHFGVTVAATANLYYNQATALASGYSVAPTGPTAPVTVTPSEASADLSVSMSDVPDPVTVNLPVAYAVTTTNHGPDPASGVTLTDTIPAGTAFQSASWSQGTCSENGGIVTCSGATLGDGEELVVTVVVVPGAKGDISNQAAAVSNETDPNPGDNSATETTSVNSTKKNSASAYDDGSGVTVFTGRAGGRVGDSNPEITTATVPPGPVGEVTVEQSGGSPSDCPGYECLAKRSTITAPSATPEDPLTFMFTIAKSTLPAGTKLADVVVFHDGVLVPDCTSSGGEADPNPCLLLRTKCRSQHGGVAYQITVVSSSNGKWRPAKPAG